MAKKPAKKVKKPTIEGGEAKLALSRHFAKIAKAPLKKQGTSDAWNERSNRIAASRDALSLRAKGIIEINRAKAAKKKVAKREKAAKKSLQR